MTVADRENPAGAGDTWEEAVLWLRAQPDSHDLVMGAYYDDPLAAAADRFWRSEEWAATRGLIGAKPGFALDIGAGRGIASYALARDGWQVTALEPDASAIVGAAAIRALVRENDLSIAVEQRLSERLPFADASFDLVYGRAVLHHISDLSAATAEFARVLKSGGRVVFVREHVISREEDRHAFFDAHPLHHRYGGENAHLRQVYERALTDAGLTLVEVIGPLTNAVNYAPQSAQSLIRDIARRVPGPGVFGALFGALLRLPGLGKAGMRLLEAVDHRPGRHYSFVATRH